MKKESKIEQVKEFQNFVKKLDLRSKLEDLLADQKEELAEKINTGAIWDNSEIDDAVYQDDVVERFCAAHDIDVYDYRDMQADMITELQIVLDNRLAAIISYMDNQLREDIIGFYECSNRKLITEYCQRDDEFAVILKTEFRTVL